MAQVTLPIQRGTVRLSFVPGHTRKAAVALLTALDLIERKSRFDLLMVDD